MQDAAPGTQIWLCTHDPSARSVECGLAVFREQQHAHKTGVPTTLTGEVCKQENLHPKKQTEVLATHMACKRRSTHTGVCHQNI